MRATAAQSQKPERRKAKLERNRQQKRQAFSLPCKKFESATFEFSGLQAEEKDETKSEGVDAAKELIRDYLGNWRGPKSVAGEKMGKKEQKDHSTVESDDKVEAVLHLLRKHSPLTLKQEKFCNRACVSRFLRTKGDNVKRAAKQLRSCLSWRSSLGIESLIADEFTAELAEGLAYVAGLDDECRPVLGVRAFMDLSPTTTIVSMLDFQDSYDYDDFSSSYPSRVSSLRFDKSPTKPTDKISSSASSRFTFTVSRDGLDTVKPWCLTLTDTSSSSKLGHTSAYISPLNARSFSFASPAARREPIDGPRRSFFASTPMPARTSDRHSIGTLRDPRIPRPSFFQSPAVFFRRESHVSKSEKPRDTFVPFLKFYRRPYDEMTYRSKMRPPLGGLVSIVSSQIRRRHVSLSQRF
ncbi:hypothetical protein Bca4012_097227 [Brassica carinata]